MLANKIHIRQQMRQQRLQVAPAQRLNAATKVAQHLLQLPFYQCSKNFAVYNAHNGEISVDQIIKILLMHKKNCYLPILHPLRENRLYFARYYMQDVLQPNKYGILEPNLQTAEIIPPWGLDVVLLPLVAFTKTGERLGMGKGFYDRTFAFTKNKSHKTPKLVGIAYDFQQQPTLPTASWDVNLNAIITEKQIYEVR